MRSFIFRPDFFCEHTRTGAPYSLCLPCLLACPCSVLFALAPLLGSLLGARCPFRSAAEVTATAERRSAAIAAHNSQTVALTHDIRTMHIIVSLRVRVWCSTTRAAQRTRALQQQQQRTRAHCATHRHRQAQRTHRQQRKGREIEQCDRSACCRVCAALLTLLNRIAAARPLAALIRCGLAPHLTSHTAAFLSAATHG